MVESGGAPEACSSSRGAHLSLPLLTRTRSKSSKGLRKEPNTAMIEDLKCDGDGFAQLIIQIQPTRSHGNRPLHRYPLQSGETIHVRLPTFFSKCGCAIIFQKLSPQVHTKPFPPQEILVPPRRPSPSSHQPSRTFILLPISAGEERCSVAVYPVVLPLTLEDGPIRVREPPRALALAEYPVALVSLIALINQRPLAVEQPILYLPVVRVCGVHFWSSRSGPPQGEDGEPRPATRAMGA